MKDSPFEDALEGALCGKYVRVHSDTGVFEGWVEDVHHDRGSIVLCDATNVKREESVGSVFVRVCDAVEVLKPKQRIEFRRIEGLRPHPEYDDDATPAESLVRQCYETGFPGVFPVVRDSGTIIDGHEAVAAAELAGLEAIPVEVVDVTDQQAATQFRLTHRSKPTPDSDEGGAGTSAEQPSEGDESANVGAEGDKADSSDIETDGHDEDTDEDDDEDSGAVFGYGD